MDRRSVLLGSAGICTTLVAVAVSSEIAEAQDAKQSVQKAIDSFGAALSSLDLNKMVGLWSLSFLILATKSPPSAPTQ
jgi:hypothetical protein